MVSTAVTIYSGPPSASPSTGKLTEKLATNSPNRAITQHDWARLQRCGKLAAKKLMQILEKPDFDKLPVKEQAVLIGLAMKYAYAPTFDTTSLVVTDKTDAGSRNELRLLGDKASLPEYNKSKEYARR